MRPNRAKTVKRPAKSAAVSPSIEFQKLSPFELKDKLSEVADEAVKTRAVTMLNAGRGNPNWIATTPREAFGRMLDFGLSESRRTWDEPACGLAGMPHSPGIAGRFRKYLDGIGGSPASDLLRKSVDYGVKKLGFDADKFVWELADAVIGDNYPVPDRMLVHVEKIVHAFLEREMSGGRPAKGKFDLFAVEGGTAAMTYIFNSMMINRILHKGDTIALGTPIFTPYLEIPHLEEFKFRVVEVEQSGTTKEGYHSWQYPESEIKKLENPKIKAFFIANPSNPGSVAIEQRTIDQLVRLVKTKRRDLILLTDDVYGTFVNGFRSLAAELPHNTILVYSYSKHFGCTGWRLGVVAIHEDNILDRMIADLPARDAKALNSRYGTLTTEPEKIKFIDRMVADSRAVALNHTAGLSLPQQLQMALFSLFALLDEGDVYKKRCQKICQDRLAELARGLEIDLPPDPLRTAYYQTLDLELWCRKNIGEDFMDYVTEHRDPLDLVFGLAREHGTVLLNGSGFQGPPWSARVSLANLDDEAYRQIGKNLAATVKRAVEVWKKAKK
jgi:aspartate 4-decarboxylase